MTCENTSDCIIPNCENMPIAHNLCNKHYLRLRNRQRKNENFTIMDLFELTERESRPQKCSIKYCREHVKTRGLCRNHATRFYQLRSEGVLTEPSQLQKWYDRPIFVTAKNIKVREKAKA